MAFIRSVITLALAAASAVDAHSYFHKAIVNGVDQGQLFGVRAPQSNSPLLDVTAAAFACNSGLHSPVSKDVIKVAPGDTFGMQWNHNLGGPTPGDADDPIAPSHKGPIIAYVAKVDDASTNAGSGLSWAKVAEEGFNTATGKWGVDTMIANAGLWDFKIPNLAPGDYLLRGELLALHSAYDVNGAQFYVSCAAIRVTGSGTGSISNGVSFPGAYSATDPGILISIYGNTGQPDNGGKAYTIPGPPVATFGAGSAPSATAKSSSAVTAKSSAAPTSAAAPTSVKTSTTTSKAAATSAPYSWPAENYPPVSSTKTVSFTAKPTTAIAIPSTTPAAAPSSSPAASYSVLPSSTSPVSFTSTFTGRIGKPTKFTCYAEE